MKKMPLKWQIALALLIILLFSWWLTTDQAKDLGAALPELSQPA